jgi:hypothetical protein
MGKHTLRAWLKGMDPGGSVQAQRDCTGRSGPPLAKQAQLLVLLVFSIGQAFATFQLFSGLLLDDTSVGYNRYHAFEKVLCETLIQLAVDLCVEQRSTCADTCCADGGFHVSVDGRFSSGQRQRSALEGTCTAMCELCGKPLDSVTFTVPRWRTVRHANGEVRRLLVQDGFLARAQSMETEGTSMLASRAKSRGELWTKLSHDECSTSFNLVAAVFPGIDHGVDANHKARGIPRNLQQNVTKWFPKVIQGSRVEAPDGFCIDVSVSDELRPLLDPRGFFDSLEGVFLAGQKTCFSRNAWPAHLRASLCTFVAETAASRGLSEEATIRLGDFCRAGFEQLDLFDPIYWNSSTTMVEGLHGLFSAGAVPKTRDYSSSYTGRIAFEL